MYLMNEVRTEAIIADHYQQAEHRRAVRTAAGKQANRLVAKYRRLAPANQRTLARKPVAQSS